MDSSTGAARHQKHPSLAEVQRFHSLMENLLKPTACDTWLQCRGNLRDFTAAQQSALLTQLVVSMAQNTDHLLDCPDFDQPHRNAVVVLRDVVAKLTETQESVEVWTTTFQCLDLVTKAHQVEKTGKVLPSLLQWSAEDERRLLQRLVGDHRWPHLTAYLKRNK
jgi:hypothetical protein